MIFFLWEYNLLNKKQLQNISPQDFHNDTEASIFRLAVSCAFKCEPYYNLKHYIINKKEITENEVHDKKFEDFVRLITNIK